MPDQNLTRSIATIIHSELALNGVVLSPLMDLPGGEEGPSFLIHAMMKMDPEKRVSVVVSPKAGGVAVRAMGGRQEILSKVISPLSDFRKEAELLGFEISKSLSVPPPFALEREEPLQITAAIRREMLRVAAKANEMGQYAWADEIEKAILARYMLRNPQ